MSTTYHRIIRKLVVGFGSLFDNITLTRYKADGTEDRKIKVPIIYSPKEKYVARLLGDPELNKKVQITLPRMSFDLLSMNYDASRKQVTNQKNVAPSGNPNSKLSQYNPVPYNFDFSLYIYVRNIEDGTQIIEHILPFFTPEYTIKLNLVPSMGVIKEVPITLNSVDYDIEYEGLQDSDARVVIWTLNFTAKAFVYGPVNEGKIIKSSFVNILNLSDLERAGRITFNMSPVGFGYYKEGETVYQGFSLDTATATGRLLYYSNTTNQMIVTDITGNFRSNTEIIGFDSFAEYTLESFDVSNANGKMITVNSYTNPANATSNSTYSIVTTVTEYNGE
ncbi:MAG: hypothetical protein EBU90_15945 [Proteobacteria bacterium]|nr:hypothetical protein [Pseudomonadota bacterium]NBP16370.1 hypothetical protein [bacterium]